MPHRRSATDAMLRRRSTFLRDDTGRMAMSNSALDSPTGRLPEPPLSHIERVLSHGILSRRESEVERALMTMDFTAAEARIITAYAAPTKRRWWIYQKNITAREWQIGRVWIRIPYWRFLKSGSCPFVRWTDRDGSYPECRTALERFTPRW